MPVFFQEMPEVCPRQREYEQEDSPALGFHLSFVLTWWWRASLKLNLMLQKLFSPREVVILFLLETIRQTVRLPSPFFTRRDRQTREGERFTSTQSLYTQHGMMHDQEHRHSIRASSLQVSLDEVSSKVGALKHTLFRDRRRRIARGWKPHWRTRIHQGDWPWCWSRLKSKGEKSVAPERNTI
jgi:hypothetical protein